MSFSWTRVFLSSLYDQMSITWCRKSALCCVYFAVDKGPDDALPRSVSFGVVSCRVKFTRWTASIYSSDPVLYQSHLVHQLKRACDVIKHGFVFLSYHEQGLTNCGRRALKELWKIEIDEAKTKEFEYLFEEKMPVQHSRIWPFSFGCLIHDQQLILDFMRARVFPQEGTLDFRWRGGVNRDVN